MAAIKISCERLAPDAKGAACFVGMFLCDDGTKTPIAAYKGTQGLSSLPIEHEIPGVGQNTYRSVVPFPVG
jgi:hypothetical protein